MRVGDGGFRYIFRDGEEGIETLSRRPRDPFLLGLVLYVASRHVDADGIAGNGVQGTFFVVGGQIPDLAAHDQGELDFIVEVDASGAEDGTPARLEDRGGRFEEEEGFLGADVVELFYVVAFRVYQLDVFLWLTLYAESVLSEGEKSIRVVPSNADYFAAIGRDAAT